MKVVWVFGTWIAVAFLFTVIGAWERDVVLLWGGGLLSGLLIGFFAGRASLRHKWLEMDKTAAS